MLANQTMPCAACKELVASTIARRVICEHCGTFLARHVPIFFMQEPPYGWRWIPDPHYYPIADQRLLAMRKPDASK